MKKKKELRLIIQYTDVSLVNMKLSCSSCHADDVTYSLPCSDKSSTLQLNVLLGNRASLLCLGLFSSPERQLYNFIG